MEATRKEFLNENRKELEDRKKLGRNWEEPRKAIMKKIGMKL